MAHKGNYQYVFGGPAESWQKLHCVLIDRAAVTGPLIGRSDPAVISRVFISLYQQQVPSFKNQERGVLCKRSKEARVHKCHKFECLGDYYPSPCGNLPGLLTSCLAIAYTEYCLSPSRCSSISAAMSAASSDARTNSPLTVSIVTDWALK